MTTVLALLFATLPLYLVRFDIAGIPTTIFELALYGASIAGLWVAVRSEAVRARLAARRAWFVPAALLVLGATVSLGFVVDLRTALGVWKGFIVDPILLYALTLAFAVDERSLRQIVGGYLLGALGVALWGIAEAIVGPGARAIGPYAVDGDASPNYLAFALAPAVPLALWLARAQRSWWLALLAALLGLAVVLSASRAGIAGMALGVVVGLVIATPGLWRRTVVRRATVLGLLLALSVSWFVVRPDFTRSAAEGGRTVTSNNVRWQLWGATSELVAAHPLRGTGLGQFQAAFTTRTADRVNFPEYIAPLARTPHNLFVTLWLETTVLGLLAGFAALVIALRPLFVALRGRAAPVAETAFLAAWTTLLVQGLLDAPIWKNDTMALFWLLVAASALLAGGAKTQVVR
ncbi:MAG: O-antigen ligase family protein [Patescibacteria group bacterium]|jgi:O-antigen ligase